MKSLICNPLAAPFLSVLSLLVFGIIGMGLSPENTQQFFEVGGGLEVVTYVCYGVALCVAGCLYRDYMRTPLQSSYLMFLFLWGVAVLREMGAQHWLTSTDSTAIKLRFFTNPHNPWHEKIIAGAIVLVVVGVILKLLIDYLPRLIKGFFELNPLYWTIATFGALGVISKFADRFPSHYYKAMGERLTGVSASWFLLIEEGGEALLPALFALALIQFHLLDRSTKLFRNY